MKKRFQKDSEKTKVPWNSVLLLILAYFLKNMQSEGWLFFKKGKGEEEDLSTLDSKKDFKGPEDPIQFGETPSKENLEKLREILILEEDLVSDGKFLIPLGSDNEKIVLGKKIYLKSPSYLPQQKKFVKNYLRQETNDTSFEVGSEIDWDSFLSDIALIKDVAYIYFIIVPDSRAGSSNDLRTVLRAFGIVYSEIKSFEHEVEKPSLRQWVRASFGDEALQFNPTKPF